MRSVLLSLALLLPTVASAGPFRIKRGDDLSHHDAAEKSTEKNADAAELPALEPAEGSLWDYIGEVEGSVPADESIEVSEQLDEARSLESTFLAVETGRPGPAAEVYADPVAATAADPYHLADLDPSDFDIPIVVNDDVIRWMNYFTGTGRKHYVRWLGRSTRYRPMMYAKLDAAGLPRDLVYLSMIESGYATHAYSRAAAAGLWQFITPTAKEWGLRVDWWVDDRRDPAMATDAAIGFLSHLEKKTGHWYLAWAAYNGGPSRVSRAVKKHGTTDFWTLVEKGSFPSETDNYVPKLIAAAIIGHNPELYGFTGIEYQAPLVYDEVTVGPNIGMEVLARCAGTSEADFQKLNPHLRRWALPPDGKSFKVRVPPGKAATFLATLDKIPPSERVAYQRHKVRKGETLGTIASKYGTSVSAIQSMNRVKNANRIYVGMELVIPTAGGAPPPAALASTSGRTSKKATKPKAKLVTHVVRKGEALGKIAERYRVSQKDLMRWNRISNANKVYVGQKLKVYEAASNWTSYTVRRGDTLSTIARKNGCSISELKGWNDLRSSRIYAGQKLRVRKG
jgi:membrane-bound lytic murein transglycosylase D